MIARPAIGPRLAAIAALLALAGCAEARLSPAPPAAPDCDLICHLLRLIDMPPSAPQSVPLPPPRQAEPLANFHVPHLRRAVLSTRPAVRPAHLVPVVLPAAPPAAVPEVDEPAPPQAAPVAAPPEATPERGLRGTIPGSPGITPPWFEPVRPGA